MRKGIPGWEGFYEADEEGNIYSISREFVNTLGRKYKISGRRISYFNDKDGYPTCVLCVAHLGRKTLSVHRTIVSTFMGTIPAGLQVNHKNGIKSDNRVKNLEICTGSENKHHAYKNGLMFVGKGELSHYKKLDNCKVREIRIELSRGYNNRVIAEKYGVCPGTIRRIRLGLSWGHVQPV
jgi:hypothetical protein